MEPKLRQIGIDSRERANKTVTKSSAVLKFFKEDSQLATNYASGISTLQFRSETLEALLKATEGTAVEVGTEFKQWLARADVDDTNP